METFATRLNILMEETGVSSYRLAKALGVHQTTIANWKAGRKPQAKHMADVAVYFGVSLKWLKGGKWDAREKEAIDIVQDFRRKGDADERTAILDDLNRILSRWPLHKLKALLELLEEG